jgi:Chaperone of endosialidase
MKNRNIVFTVILLAIACLMFSPVAQARRPSEDRGNGNSAAEGVQALNLSTTGSDNTAHGWFSLFSNTSGVQNTANGFNALNQNTTGGGNTAVGYEALFSNTTGAANTANGFFALLSNTEGNNNTAIGDVALANNTTGSLNTAIGVGAGTSVETASNVICIGHPGANLSNRCFIGNIRGAFVSGDALPVLIDSSGQLGTALSSRRFKKEIKPMDKASEAVLALKPVAFHYKNDTTNTPQFGLIAEEVAQVNPSLVVRDKNGEIYTVRYDAVNAMLLNEFLKEHRQVQEQGHRLEAQDRKAREQEVAIARQQKQIDSLTADLQKVSAQIKMRRPAPQIVFNNP